MYPTDRDVLPRFFLFEMYLLLNSARPTSQAMIRAGVKTKEETKMTRMESTGNFKIPHYIHYLQSV